MRRGAGKRGGADEVFVGGGTGREPTAFRDPRRQRKMGKEKRERWLEKGRRGSEMWNGVDEGVRG